MSITVGEVAPDFTLANQYGEPVTLSDFRSKKNVVVMFYPFAFTGICTDELCTIRDRRADFINDDTEVLSISCDPTPSLKVFSEQENLTHNLLSDFYPHGAVAQQYGAFLADKGFATRAAFVIDKEGVVRWAVVNGPGEARDADDYLTALAEIG
jgi:mycoredoxin-dependent peroxiredoxin